MDGLAAVVDARHAAGPAARIGRRTARILVANLSRSARAGALHSFSTVVGRERSALVAAGARAVGRTTLAAREADLPLKDAGAQTQPEEAAIDQLIAVVGRLAALPPGARRGHGFRLARAGFGAARSTIDGVAAVVRRVAATAGAPGGFRLALARVLRVADVPLRAVRRALPRFSAVVRALSAVRIAPPRVRRAAVCRGRRRRLRGGCLRDARDVRHRRFGFESIRSRWDRTCVFCGPVVAHNRDALVEPQDQPAAREERSTSKNQGPARNRAQPAPKEAGHAAHASTLHPSRAASE
jgi:hypothetical protein